MVDTTFLVRCLVVQWTPPLRHAVMRTWPTPRLLAWYQGCCIKSRMSPRKLENSSVEEIIVQKHVVGQWSCCAQWTPSLKHVIMQTWCIPRVFAWYQGRCIKPRASPRYLENSSVKGFIVQKHVGGQWSFWCSVDTCTEARVHADVVGTTSPRMQS